LVLSLNGIPVATGELKNPMTAQTWRHAVTQYKQDRDPADLIFQFKKRALVHFAVDTDEVYMTTRLSGRNTRFLPFNQGRGTGAGNPDNPGGYKTAYLWEKVLERQSFLDIVAGFIHLQIEEKKLGGKKVSRETMIFPRYHQLDCVRQLVTGAREQGAGTNYLVQHSAGSGKSNSIAWLAHQLIGLRKDGAEVFDSIIVVTDRRLLDRQIRETIKGFAQVGSIIGAVKEGGGSSKTEQLSKFLKDGKKIIICTVQTFPHVLDCIGGEHRGAPRSTPQGGASRSARRPTRPCQTWRSARRSSRTQGQGPVRSDAGSGVRGR